METTHLIAGGLPVTNALDLDRALARDGGRKTSRETISWLCNSPRRETFGHRYYIPSATSGFMWSTSRRQCLVDEPNLSMNSLILPASTNPQLPPSPGENTSATAAPVVPTPTAQQESPAVQAPVIKQPRKAIITPKTAKLKPASKTSLPPPETATKTAEDYTKAKPAMALGPEAVLKAAKAKALTVCLKQLKLGVGSVAEALQTIRDKKLFEEKYGTWEKFVRAECAVGLAYANRLVQANRILNSTTFVADQKPKNIAQAVALYGVPEAKLRDVMREAVKFAGTRPLTTANIAKAVKLVDPKPKAPGKGHGGGEGAGPDKAAKAQPVKLVDALGWVTSLRANLKDSAKVEASLALLDLIELAIQSNTLIDAPADKPTARVAR